MEFVVRRLKRLLKKNEKNHMVVTIYKDIIARCFYNSNVIKRNQNQFGWYTSNVGLIRSNFSNTIVGIYFFADSCQDEKDFIQNEVMPNFEKSKDNPMLVKIKCKKVN